MKYQPFAESQNKLFDIKDDDGNMTTHEKFWEVTI